MCTRSAARPQVCATATATAAACRARASPLGGSARRRSTKTGNSAPPTIVAFSAYRACGKTRKRSHTCPGSAPKTSPKASAKRSARSAGRRPGGETTTSTSTMGMGEVFALRGDTRPEGVPAARKAHGDIVDMRDPGRSDRAGHDCARPEGRENPATPRAAFPPSDRDRNTIPSPFETRRETHNR